MALFQPRLSSRQSETVLGEYHRHSKHTRDVRRPGEVRMISATDAVDEYPRSDSRPAAG